MINNGINNLTKINFNKYNNNLNQYKWKKKFHYHNEYNKILKHLNYNIMQWNNE